MTGFLLSFVPKGLTATISLAYDANGNESSQQSAGATAPVILSQPASRGAEPGGTVGFVVIVDGGLPLSFQWFFNGNAITGATRDNLLLTNVSSVNEGDYTVRVTNSIGSVTSSAARFFLDVNNNNIPDSWELLYFGNLNHSGEEDWDGDGLTNLQEYQQGGDPLTRATNYWIAASGDFNNPSNWSLNRVPGLYDAAVINTGTFTLPTSGTITATRVTVNVPFSAPTDVDVTLNVTGIWSFNGAFTLANGRQFMVSGGGFVAITGVTSLNGANLLTYGGAKVTFSNLGGYTLPAGVSARWISEGAGSELIFANLELISGNTTPYYYLDISAQYGGKVSFPALTTITKPNDGDEYANSGVRLHAFDGSVLSVPQLSSFQDNDIHPASFLHTEGSTGIIEMPLLLAPVGVQINMNAASHPEQFTSLIGTRSFEINNGTVNITNLNSLAGFTYLRVGGGAKLTFSNVSSYTLPAGLSVEWNSEGTGSELIFANLESISGNATPYCYLNISAQNAGKVSFPVLTTITKPNDGDEYVNSGMRLYAYNGSVISAPQLSRFRDHDIHPASLLHADGNAGIIEMPLLLAPLGVQININAASHPEQFTSLVGTYSFEVNNGTVNIMNLNSLAGFTYVKASGGAKLTFSNVSNYTLPTGLSVEWSSEGTGSELIFANLESISGNATPYCYLNIRAQNAGKVSFPLLTTITKPNDGDEYVNSGVRLYAYNGSIISAPHLSSFRDNDIHPASSLHADGNAGIIEMPLLLAPVGVQINLNAASHPEQFTSLVGTRSFEINNGTVNIINLNSLAGFTYLRVGGGAKLTFSNVSSYTLPAGLSVEWSSEGTGSELIFANLESISASATPYCYLNIIAQNGGKVSFPLLTTITKPNDGDEYANSGVRLYAYNGSVISAPQLISFYDDDIHPNSLLYADGTGMMVLTSLTQSGIRGVTLNGITLSQSPLPIPNISDVTISGGSIRITFPTVTNHTYQLQQADTPSSANWEDVGAAQSGTGGLIEFVVPVEGGKKFYHVKITPWP